MAFTSAIVMKNSDRSQVLVLGERPIDKKPFEQRNLVFTPIKIEQLDDKILTNNARGVLLAPFPGKFALIYSYFEERFHRACELGLMTAVYVTEKKAQVSEIRDNVYAKFKVGEDIDDLNKRRRWIESLPWVYLGEEDWAIAETLARYDPGPPLGTPTIDKSGVTESLDPESETMLKRAFHNADRITVNRLEGGRTAKETFCVFANLDGADFGPQPMPFFVKLGSAWKVDDEKRNYRELAEPFIPFHLRPSLNDARSVTNLTTAALVCNFVEGAVSLRDALRAGQGDGTIFSLFEFTLRGLRNHTLNRPKRSGVIEAFLASRVKAHEIEAKHPARIKQLRDIGMTRKPEEVEWVLRKFASKIETREGTYHGDLHFGNIMVRHRDAIVIDFGSMGPFGPLYADPAILEVSLIFGTDDHDDPESFDVWRKFVDYVFLDPLSPPLPKGDYPQFAWLHKAVRELRHVVACCGIEKPEALIILAGCLLRYGRNSSLKLKSKELDLLAENRRFYALVVAYQICEWLEKHYAAC
jgi:hypothetical protein